MATLEKIFLYSSRVSQRISATDPQTDEQKLDLLINLVSPAIFKHISDINDYSSAINVLKEVFVQPKNSIFRRHLLATRRQQTDKSVDQYLQSLKKLAKDCDFQAVTVIQTRDEYTRDAFINGISSNHIRQMLLKNKTLDLQTAYNQALTLEMAPKQSASYTQSDFSICTAEAGTYRRSWYTQSDSLTASVSTVRTEETDDGQSVSDEQPTVAAFSGQECFFFGNRGHDRSKCFARNSICKKK